MSNQEPQESDFQSHLDDVMTQFMINRPIKNRRPLVNKKTFLSHFPDYLMMLHHCPRCFPKMHVN